MFFLATMVVYTVFTKGQSISVNICCAFSLISRGGVYIMVKSAYKRVAGKLYAFITRYGGFSINIQGKLGNFRLYSFMGIVFCKTGRFDNLYRMSSN